MTRDIKQWIATCTNSVNMTCVTNDIYSTANRSTAPSSWLGPLVLHSESEGILSLLGCGHPSSMLRPLRLHLESELFLIMRTDRLFPSIAQIGLGMYLNWTWSMSSGLSGIFCHFVSLTRTAWTPSGLLGLLVIHSDSENLRGVGKGGCTGGLSERRK